MRKMCVLFACATSAVVMVVATVMIPNATLWKNAVLEQVKGGACYTFTANSCPGTSSATCTGIPCTSTDGGTTWNCGTPSVKKQLTVGFFNCPTSVETGGFEYPRRKDTQCSSTVKCSTCKLDTQSGKQMCSDGAETNDPLTPSCELGSSC